MREATEGTRLDGGVHDGGLDAAQRTSRSAEDLDADLDGYMQE